MCKAYFKVSDAFSHVRASRATKLANIFALQDLRRSGRSVQEDWPEFAAYARINGSHFSPLLALPSAPSSPPVPPSHSPDFGASSSPNLGSTSPIIHAGRDTESHGPRTAFSPVLPDQPLGRTSVRGRWSERRSKAPTVIARDRAIEKAALVEGAERIYLRYLLPGAEREIYLP